jgi:hypothetical protein
MYINLPDIMNRMHIDHLVKEIFPPIQNTFHFGRVLRHHGMARPQVTDGGRPPDRRVAADILNKKSRTTNKGWSSSLGVGRGAKNLSP